MADEEKKSMIEYGITSEPKTRFNAHGYCYGQLREAFISTKNRGPSSLPPEHGSSK